MNQQADTAGMARHQTEVERVGDRELVVTRLFDAPPSTVYRAWSEPALFQRWWVPKSVPGVTLVSCDMDVRTGGKYRLEFGAAGSDSMAFYGKYLEVVPNERIIWTNDEGEEGAVTTVTFEERQGQTLLTFREVYPTPEALEEALAGSAAGLPEQLQQLGDMLAGMGDDARG
ncbi:MAG: SRPBCC family protein [Devosia sp.]